MGYVIVFIVGFVSGALLAKHPEWVSKSWTWFKELFADKKPEVKVLEVKV